MAPNIPIASGINMDPPSPTQKPFRFFDLPRELRDLIYGNLTRDVHIPALGHIFTNKVMVDCTNYRSMQPLLVSHRFRDEYEEQMAKGEHQEVEISIPVELFTPSATTLQFLTHNATKFLTKVKRMHLNLGGTRSLWHGHMNFGDWENTERQIMTGQWSMAKHVVDTLLPLFPSLDEAVVRFRCSYARLESKIFEGGDFEELKAPALRTRLFAAKPEVEVKVVLLLSGPMWQSYGNDQAGFQTKLRQNKHFKNEVTFEGRFSSGPYAWHGLDLAVPAGQIQSDFDEVSASIVAMEAAMEARFS